MLSKGVIEELFDTNGYRNLNDFLNFLYEKLDCDLSKKDLVMFYCFMKFKFDRSNGNGADLGFFTSLSAWKREGYEEKLEKILGETSLVKLGKGEVEQIYKTLLFEPESISDSSYFSS